MKYILSVFLFFLSLSLGAQEIKIYTWENYISDKVIHTFEDKTGHTVKLYYYDNEVDRDTVLINPDIAGKYDLVIVDSALMQRYGELGWLQPLPIINNVKNNSQQSINACDRYGIPYGQGTMGIIYRASVSKKKITSWNDLLNPPQEHIGTTMMILESMDSVAIALLALGLDPFSTNKSELKSAFSLLQAQSNSLMAYGYPLTYTSEQGEKSQLTLAALYSGDLTNIKNNTGQDDWQYIVPEEGTLFFVDCFAVPSAHPISEASKDFISYLNEPAVAYQNASAGDTWFSTTNQAALLMADENYKNDSEIFPDKNSQQKSYPYKTLAEKELTVRARMISLLQIKE